MASSPQLLALAVRHGHVGAHDVHGGRAGVRPLPRSNPVHAVELEGEAVVYVKQSGWAAQLDGDDTVATELGMLAALAGSRIAPTLIRQGGSGLAWMSAVPGVEFAALADAAVVPEAAGELGRVLARLHCLPVAGSPVVPMAPPPWPLGEGLPPSMSAALEHPRVRGVWDLLHEPAVHAAVQQARGAYRPGCLVHGDVSGGNIMVSWALDRVDLRLIDFELSGWGDPAHDVASALALLAERESAPDAAEVWGLAPGPVARRFLTAYEQAGGPGQTSPAVACVRALMTAWQVAATHGDERVDELEQWRARARTTAAEAVR